MQHLRDLNAHTLERCALTIGSFDGVHRGHQTLIRAMVEDARQKGLPAVVLTFFPHPSVVLRGRQPALYITTPEEKAALMANLGVDYVITQRFDQELSQISATAFLDKLESKLGLQVLWIGEDFALGHRREGNRLFLEEASKKRGFELHVHPPVIIGGEVVSSTRVREALRSGDVARVAHYLGRTFVVPGKVVPGANRGKRIGIPTANLEIWGQRAYPGAGVYACVAEVEEERWKAVTNIGVRPTFEQGQQLPTIEAHLLDYEGSDLYGCTMRLIFVDRLRDERRFPGPKALRDQIERDIRRARRILERKEGELDDGGI